MLDRQKLASLKGVGPRLTEKLRQLGLETVQDMLFHLPYRYQDKTRLTPPAALRPWTETLTQGVITRRQVAHGRRPSLLVTLDHGALTLRFFHYRSQQMQQFRPGWMVRAYGEARPGPTGLEMVHPQYRAFPPHRPPALEETLTPLYPSTEGIGQATWLRLTEQALNLLTQRPLEECLPEAWLQERALPTLNAALRTVHRPSPDDDLPALMAGEHPAQKRLILEELIAHQAALARLRARRRQLQAPPLRGHALAQRLIERLPFALTPAQRRVVEEIRRDLARAHPMQRLVQGDVGSGKTIVAALAALTAAEAGWQTAVMAPTEILAEQHRTAFQAWLEPLGVETAWLGGRMKTAERRAQLDKIADGTAKVIIGTHALFQKPVQFQRLGLTVIDEQHRFGVHQRLALRQKGERESAHPHQLIMTATPIPRTLAMAAYGDLDISTIDALPPGRKPVRTAAIGLDRREEVMDQLAARCREGVQAYWVCPLIEESELLDAQAAEAVAETFRRRYPDLKIGLAHGRMKAEDKARVMSAFAAGELQLLVATTVIEVGVDVPNATLMVIENAERLGLAQLHQLRGRVGRGARQSYCVLLYQPPLSDTARQRLQIMRETNDGFRIAEADLQIRGPGEVLGVRQTGGLQFRLAQLPRDEALLEEARALAQRLQTQMPDSAAALYRRWLGRRERFALA